MHCINEKQRSVILGEINPVHATRRGKWYLSAMTIVTAELLFHLVSTHAPMKAHGVLCRLVTKYEFVCVDAKRPRYEYLSHVWTFSDLPSSKG